MFFRRLVGGSLLVSGTSIGAGMLALPIVTAQGGFLPAFIIYLLCWIFMTCTGLLMLEICLKLPPDANLISMASHFLGRSGQIFAWILYLFLFYSLSIAYISGGGGLLRDWLSLPPWAATLLFLFLLAPVVYRGAKAVDRMNHIMMGGLILTYLAFIFLGFPYVHWAPLQRSNWGSAFLALPVVFTSFSYQGIIPSLTAYLRRDAKSVRIAIISGTSLAFIIYLIWEFLILGIVPVEGEFGLARAMELGKTAVQPLHHYAKTSSILWIGQAFAFFAIATSFLGVNLGLLDFLADGLSLPKKGIRHLFLSLITFSPPLVVALINPSLFIIALVFAGGIGCALLLGFLPTLMTWVARYVRREDPNTFQLGGGRGVLILLFLFVFLEVALEFFHEWLGF